MNHFSYNTPININPYPYIPSTGSNTYSFALEPEPKTDNVMYAKFPYEKINFSGPAPVPQFGSTSINVIVNKSIFTDFYTNKKISKTDAIDKLIKEIDNIDLSDIKKSDDIVDINILLTNLKQKIENKLEILERKMNITDTDFVEPSEIIL